MKSFGQFILEARTRSKEDAAKILANRYPDPEERALHRLKNRGSTETPLWGSELRANQKGQQKRRAKNLKPISYDDLLSHAKRNLYPNPKELAKKALRDERTEKGSQTRTRNRLTKETGKKYNVDHIVPQPDRRREELRSRFQAIHPGDASANREVSDAVENREKNSKNTRTTLTRASAIRTAFKGSNN